METDDLKLIVSVASKLSFAEVARAADMDPSAVSRTVAKVEAELGFELFHRSTRQMQVTDAGHKYVARITPLLEGLDDAHIEVSNASQSPSGTVRLTASTAFGQEVVLPLIGEFSVKWPDIELQLILTDHVIDLLSDQVDIAIRLAAQPLGDFTCSKLLDTSYRVVAPPKFQDDVKEPEDLRHQNCIRLDLPQYREAWTFEQDNTPPITIPVDGKIIISNPLALREAAKQGLGATLLPDWMIDQDIAAGDLIDLFPGWQVSASNGRTAAWLLYPTQKFMPKSTRVVIDFLKSHVGKG